MWRQKGILSYTVLELGLKDHAVSCLELRSENALLDESNISENTPVTNDGDSER